MAVTGQISPPVSIKALVTPIPDRSVFDLRMMMTNLFPFGVSSIRISEGCRAAISDTRKRKKKPTTAAVKRTKCSLGDKFPKLFSFTQRRSSTLKGLFAPGIPVFHPFNKGFRPIIPKSKISFPVDHMEEPNRRNFGFQCTGFPVHDFQMEE